MIPWQQLKILTQGDWQCFGTVQGWVLALTLLHSKLHNRLSASVSFKLNNQNLQVRVCFSGRQEVSCRYFSPWKAHTWSWTMNLFFFVVLGRAQICDKTPAIGSKANAAAVSTYWVLSLLSPLPSLVLPPSPVVLIPLYRWKTETQQY
jgi:hypothetical protein